MEAAWVSVRFKSICDYTQSSVKDLYDIIYVEGRDSLS